MGNVETVRLEHEAGLAWITIQRPERFNSLDVETARDFRRAGLQCARDEAVRAVIVRGTRGVFCSGADLKRVRDPAPDAELGYSTRLRMTTLHQSVAGLAGVGRRCQKAR